MGSKADVNKLAELMREELHYILAALKTIDKVDWKVIGRVMIFLVHRIELLAKEVGEGEFSGQDKKRALVTVVNEVINLPFLPEFVEAHLFSAILDIIVAAYNEAFGHFWIEKVADYDREDLRAFICDRSEVAAPMGTPPRPSPEPSGTGDGGGQDDPGLGGGSCCSSE